MARGMKDVASQVEEGINTPAVEKIERVDFLTTGCLPLNLAMSGKGRKGGIPRGRVTNLVGDGSAGKSLVSLEICAHAFYKIKRINSPIFGKTKNLRIRYRNVEGVMDFPVELMYGKEFNDAVEWVMPSDKKTPMTIEEFGADIFSCIAGMKKGDSLIYVLDSLDAIKSVADIEHMNESVAKFEKGKDPGSSSSGTYGTGRAKYLSSFFARYAVESSGKDVTLIIVSQVRENLNAVGKYAEKYYRAGGKTLDFYTHIVAWLYQVGKIKSSTKISGKVYDRKVGTQVKAVVKRSKVSLPYREAEFKIVFNHGVDQIGSCADVFSAEELAKMAAEFGYDKPTREDFVLLCENDPALRNALFDATERRWMEVEAATEIKRRRTWEDDF